MLKPKEYTQIDFDDAESMEFAGKNIKDKKCLYDIYCETYDMMVNLAETYLNPSAGKELELGSGGGFMGERYPRIITSDVEPRENTDMVIDAQKLPFEKGELSTIYAMHVFHHIPDVRKFLQSASETLQTGGGIVLVEPYYGPFASVLYDRIHPEPFNKRAKQWIIDSSGPMSGSNQALSYIVFKRDKREFEREFPNLKVVYEKPFGCLRYMATGGLWLKPKLPGFMFPVLKGVEKVFAPCMYLIGIHHVIVIKKME